MKLHRAGGLLSLVAAACLIMLSACGPLSDNSVRNHEPTPITEGEWLWELGVILEEYHSLVLAHDWYDLVIAHPSTEAAVIAGALGGGDTELVDTVLVDVFGTPLEESELQTELRHLLSNAPGPLSSVASSAHSYSTHLQNLREANREAARMLLLNQGDRVPAEPMHLAGESLSHSAVELSRLIDEAVRYDEELMRDRELRKAWRELFTRQHPRLSLSGLRAFNIATSSALPKEERAEHSDKPLDEYMLNDGTTSAPLSADAVEYARLLGGTSHEGDTLHLIVGAIANPEEFAQKKLDDQLSTTGDMHGHFFVQKSDNFEGLEPGWFIVAEAYGAYEDAERHLDAARHGYETAKNSPLIEKVVVRTDDPIPVVYVDIDP